MLLWVMNLQLYGEAFGSKFMKWNISYLRKRVYLLSLKLRAWQQLSTLQKFHLSTNVGIEEPQSRKNYSSNTSQWCANPTLQRWTSQLRKTYKTIHWQGHDNGRRRWRCSSLSLQQPSWLVCSQSISTPASLTLPTRKMQMGPHKKRPEFEISSHRYANHNQSICYFSNSLVGKTNL